MGCGVLWRIPRCSSASSRAFLAAISNAPWVANCSLTRVARLTSCRFKSTKPERLSLVGARRLLGSSVFDCRRIPHHAWSCEICARMELSPPFQREGKRCARQTRQSLQRPDCIFRVQWPATYSDAHETSLAAVTHSGLESAQMQGTLDSPILRATESIQQANRGNCEHKAQPTSYWATSEDDLSHTYL